ncbi:hypothetical protein LTS08_002191 [Lithohypha guttulata]|uniref:uncharacterized protein n=1 Tax=Lithohypha guttulata TaxID=1690604 RepID=UPI002DE0AE98|nr:hypothetical protein LTR51_004293 [Lithohypha guttulata]KAK5104303.1 hypothetical protein LTS08_002191 [Lithohypha guttulata]
MSCFTIREHRVPASYIREYPHALANDQEEQLYLAVKQYIPLENKKEDKRTPCTIIGAHANAFNKELYEPLWEDLIKESEKHNYRIVSIWIADVAHQGESSVINEDKLGNDPGWYDHPRDLTYLINLKRNEMPRPIFGLGHSMGGNNLVNVALFNPRLFTSLVLLDPVIQQRTAEIAPPGMENAPSSVAKLSTFRRDIWPSRAEAAKLFAKSPFYKKWDKRVLDRWIEYGLRDCPTALHPEAQSPQVTLTTSVANEVHTFLRPNYEGYGAENPEKKINRYTHPDIVANMRYNYPFYRSEGPRTFARLPEVRPSVLYIFGSESDVSGDEFNNAKLKTTGVGVGGSGGQAEGRVKGVTLEGVGHLIAMEAVERTAAETSNWIESEVERWRREEEDWQRNWKTKSLREKQDVDEKWKAMMGGDPRAKKRQKDTKL